MRTAINEQLIADAHSKYTQNDEEHYLEEVPISIVCDLEQHKLAASIWVHGLVTL